MRSDCECTAGRISESGDRGGRESANEPVPARFRALMSEGAMLADHGPSFFHDAMRAYMAAARLSENDPQPLVAAARLCRKSGRWRQARRLYLAAAGRDNRLWQAWAEGAECFDWFAHFRRAMWIASAIQAARRAGQAIPRDLQERFLANYGRLRRWERWLVRMRME